MAAPAAPAAWPPGSGEMARLIRAHDWAATALGPPSGWPAPLRTAVELILAMPQVASIAVGPGRLLLYNDLAAREYGPRHPRALGRPLAEALADPWARLAGPCDRVFGGEGVHVPAPPAGSAGTAAPEVYDAALTPLRDGDGAVLAAVCVFTPAGGRVRAEAGLRASEARFRTLTEAAPALIWWNDAEGANTFVNRRFLDYTGLAPEAVAGEAWQALVHPDEAGAYVAGYLRAVRARQPWQDRARLRRHDGAWRTFENQAQPVFGGDGAYLGHIGVSLDVTESLTAETAQREGGERQAFLLRLSDALRAEPDVDAVARRALGLILERMDLDRTYITIYRPEDDEAVFPYQLGNDTVPALPARVRLSDFPEAYERVLHGTFVVEDDAERPGLSDAERANSRALGMRAMLASTIRRGEGRPLASLMAVASRPRRWTPGEIALVEEAAERTWAAMERARTEAALRASEARLAAAFESAPVGVAVMDASGAAVLANAGYRRFVPTGLTPFRDPARIGRWRAWDAEGRPLDPQDWPSARALRGERVVPGQEMLYAEEDGREVWTSVSSVPIRDGAGAVTGAATVITDIDAAKRSADALRESEERLRQFGEASTDVLWIRDAETLEWTYLTPAFEAIYGMSREEALRGDTLGNWLDLIVPDDWERAAGGIGRAQKGERVTFEYRIRRPRDGEVRWLRNTDFPIRDAEGRITHIGGVGHDATAEKAAQAAMEVSERRLRTLMTGIPQLVWRAVDHGQWTWASPQWTALTGQPEAESHGWGWLGMVHPDDRAAAREGWDASRESGAFEVEYRVRSGATGTYRWFQTRAAPVTDDRGRLLEWLGTSTDVQDLRELQDRLKVLLAELQHRTRNLMSVVQAVSRRTLAGARSLEDFEERFQDRMAALARVNSLLSRLTEGDRITFDELIRTELRAHGALDRDGWGPQVTLDGPDGVRLKSSTVQTLALALHELATNAMKYGALAQRRGRVAVRWRREEAAGAAGGGRPQLRVEWIESGVAMPPPGAAAEGGGYGRELIERALPYQLGAETAFTMGADGVRCTIALPLSSQETAHA